MDKRTCTEPGCERKHLAKGLCSTHYSYWHRAHAKYRITCDWCGKEASVPRSEQRFCSFACSQKHVANTPAAKALREARRVAAKAPTTKSPDEIQAMHKARRSPFRVAVEDFRYDGLLDAIAANSVTTLDGCWHWKKTDKNGYPIKRVGNRDVYVHRLSLEAKHGKPLGVLAAHHRCANTYCVNPDHLQPITHRENVAEMMARRSLESRIAELEEAVRQIDPGHAVLNRIPTSVGYDRPPSPSRRDFFAPPA
jgi:hypothetical protein